MEEKQKLKSILKKTGLIMAGIPCILVGVPILCLGTLLKVLGNIVLWELRDAERELQSLEKKE